MNSNIPLVGEIHLKYVFPTTQGKIDKVLKLIGEDKGLSYKIAIIGRLYKDIS